MNEDFFVGYSPERINPGDKEHRLPTILKVTSGSTPEAAELYRRRLPVDHHGRYAQGVEHQGRRGGQGDREHAARRQHRPDQRAGDDLRPCRHIDTEEVLIAAGTKWNFLPFRPGLVGGHCIGVDPYYLTYKAQQLGYHPQMILAGRRINDNMAQYMSCHRSSSACWRRASSPNEVTGAGSRPDVQGKLSGRAQHQGRRYRRGATASYGASVDVHDPWVDAEEAREPSTGSTSIRGAGDEYLRCGRSGRCPQGQFRELGRQGVRSFGKEKSVVYDIKYVLPPDQSDDRL